MPRGRPRKVKVEIPEVEKVIVEEKKIEPKKDTRVDRRLLPIKYNEDLVESLKITKAICPLPHRTSIGQCLLMIDWFIGVMDGLNNSGVFTEEGGWREKYKIEKPIVDLTGVTDDID